MERIMRDPRTLGPWLRRFLTDYIVTERRLARNTQESYYDYVPGHVIVILCPVRLCAPWPFDAAILSS
jgi:hypothetical protein